MTQRDLHDLKILIVEDNIHFRTLLLTILWHLGIRDIREVSDGQSALEMLEDYDADLTIVDWKLEGIDGLETIRRIRQSSEEGIRRIPVLMVTGYGEDPLPAQARDAGANHFLVKPISPKSLMKSVFAVLREPTTFIETPAYVGPDRRKLEESFSGLERRAEQNAG